jgi:iron complex outermembrane receptor protein
MVFAHLQSLFAEKQDTSSVTILKEVTVMGSYGRDIDREITLPVAVADKKFLTEHFRGNIMQTLEYVGGVRSMDIGSGFSKPMIRGMGFNRIAVVENGIKHEGQQWGSDHGLEIDAFAVDRVVIRKGPSSLLFGSDAMGGVIEIQTPKTPLENLFYGEVSILGKSVNETFAESVMMGLKRGVYNVKFRFTSQDYGDYKIPADTVVYLTQRMTVDNRKLKNTAGLERDASILMEYEKGRHSGNITISNTFQKSGFFTGAHGVPDATRLRDDGDNRNIDLPYSTVNHLKITAQRQLKNDNFAITWNLGYQNNRRKELSIFHTHYGNQAAPTENPDLELYFSLVTLDMAMKSEWLPCDRLKHSFGWDVQGQDNNIAGYSFLLPEFKRFSAGVFYLASFKMTDKLTFDGGLRVNYGKIKLSGYSDIYLSDYLYRRGYPDSVTDEYRWRGYPVERAFSDLAASFGLIWQANDYGLLKVNLGRSFRMPGANELSSNGVHHSAFRHEQGTPVLDSEKGWQADVAYTFQNDGIGLSLSPFFNLFENYIYLKPTGLWSLLPHAGQIYLYTGARAVFTGAEAELNIDFTKKMTYHFAGEYVYTHNLDENTPMSFSPPASIRNSLILRHGNIRLSAELQSIATQNRVSKNEDPTKGTNLIHLSATLITALARVSLSVYNLTDNAYYNHLSFYRKAQIPEPGRNVQLLINIPLKRKMK